MSTAPAAAFSDLSLPQPILRALTEVGYETPSPIQSQTIPLLLQGRDVLGQAQTGTGKTAAFAVPILSRIDLKQKSPQVLVLAPTRELAIQVSEAFQRYASHLKGFHVLPVYGGQDYRGQIRALQRGVHVVVGTPGRVMDHMRRGTLKLDALNTLVLDEADEMLRMGFIEDVEWILEQTPDTRQIALFSATMPTQIRRIANTYLRDASEVTIKVKTTTAESIRQRFWPVSHAHKLDALTRILEAEDFDAILIFVRTKMVTVELAEKLEARGYAATALNGDIAQNQRERTIEQLKKGKLDIVVATDVAARGLDVERISHVINYDIPYDTEAYVHRIGRTGRAGRSGDAILFVTPREKRMLGIIEKATRQKIEQMALPSTDAINDKRVAKFKQRISDTLSNNDLGLYARILEQFQQESNRTGLEIAAALAKLLQGEEPFFLKSKPEPKQSFRIKEKAERKEMRKSKPSAFDSRRPLEKGMQRFRIEVGHVHNVKPGNIVGAIANEAGIDSQYIGRIDILDDHSVVDLPEGMPKEIFNDLKKARVAGQQLRISRLGSQSNKNSKAPSQKSAKKPKKREKPADKTAAKKKKKK
ncbi:MAG: DEAD/DEAH box helicase [Pseudomonadota bacterium]